MSTETITPAPVAVDRNLNIDFLSLDDDAPHLVPGDVIHVEATLTVRNVSNGLNYRDEPTSTITARAAGKPEVVIRTTTMRPERTALGIASTVAPAPPQPKAKGRIRKAGSWLLDAPTYVPRAYVLLLFVLVCAIPLTGCSVGYVRPGDPCTTIGQTNRNKAGNVMVCKPASPSDPTGVSRWRRA